MRIRFSTCRDRRWSIVTHWNRWSVLRFVPVAGGERCQHIEGLAWWWSYWGVSSKLRKGQETGMGNMIYRLWPVCGPFAAFGTCTVSSMDDATLLFNRPAVRDDMAWNWEGRWCCASGRCRDANLEPLFTASARETLRDGLFDSCARAWRRRKRLEKWDNEKKIGGKWGKQGHWKSLRDEVMIEMQLRPRST